MKSYLNNWICEVIGVDNGDPLVLSNYKTNKRRVFFGKAMLWIQSTGQSGKVIIHAKGNKVSSKSIEVDVI